MRGDVSATAHTDGGLDRPVGSGEGATMDLFELVRLQGHLLSPDERSFLEAYLRGSNSLRQVARLTGTKPSTAWRRVRRLVRRLHACASLVCLEEPCGLTVDELAIVKDHVARGLSIEAISRARKLSYYRVRNIILTARTLNRADGAQGRRRRPSRTRTRREPSQGSSV